MDVKSLVLSTFIGASTLLHAYQPDIILDAHSDPSAVELSPSSAWADDGTVSDAFRGNAKYVSSSTANTSQFARFHTTLPQSGPWKVFVWNNGRAGFGSSVNLKVTHAEATPSTATLNQSSNGGQWFLAGVFWFDASKEAEVKIEHNASGMLSADAVRFSPAEASVEVDSTSPDNGTMAYTPNSTTWASAVDKSGGFQGVRRSTTAGSTATFFPILPAAGEYEVSMWMPTRSGAWLPSGATAPTSVEIDLHHRSGVSSFDVPIPIGAQNEGQWVQIGTGPFLFDATPTSGTNPNKLVVKSDGRATPADAVRFTKLGTFEVYLDNTSQNVAPVIWSPVSEWILNFVTNRVAQRWPNFRQFPFGPSAIRAGADSTTRSATFSPNLPELGLYDVYVWYPYVSSNAHQIRIDLNAWTQNAQGTPVVETVTQYIDQEYDGGQWRHVGRHILSSGTDGTAANRPTLKFSSNGEPSGNYTYADGVLFLRDGEETDLDQDGLADWRERVIGTSTNTSDLNGDGIADGWDTDGDGMSDGDEYRLGRNPLIKATDGSGIFTLQVYTPTQN